MRRARLYEAFVSIVLVALLLAAAVVTAPPAAAAPINDDYAAAITLTGASGSIAGSTDGATWGPCEQRSGVRTIWYRWRAPATGELRLSTSGSSTPGVLDIHPDNAACGPGGWLGTTSGSTLDRTALEVQQGASYTFRLDSGEPGVVRLNWRLVVAAPPANDDIDDAVTLYGESGIWGGTNAGASAEAGEPARAGSAAARSVWLDWTAPHSGRAVFLTRATFDTVLAVYSGSGMSDLVSLAQNDDAPHYRTGSRVEFEAVAGQTYLLGIDGKAGAEGGLSDGLLIVWNSGPAPANDAIANATPIGEAGVTWQRNVGATGEPGEPLHGGYYGGASVWFAYTAPRDGRFSLSIFLDPWVSNASFIAGAYRGTSMSTLSRVSGSNDFSGPGVRVSFPVRAGEQYRIALDGAQEWTGGFGLSWVTSPIPNDHFAAASTITGPLGTVSGSNESATAEPGEPAHGGRPARTSSWWRWTAPTSGSVTFDTLGSEGDLSLGAYTGSRVDALTTVGSVYSGGGSLAPLTFTARAGETYHVAVDTGGGSWPLRLSWRYGPRDTTPPAASVQSPATGAVVSGTLGVTATASDASGIDAVSFTIDESWAAPPDQTSPYTATVDTRRYRDGRHVLRVSTLDRASNRTISSPVELTVENLPPAISLTLIPPVTEADDVVGHLQADDRSGGQFCRLDDGPYEPCNDEFLRYDGLAPGAHVARAYAVDAFGKVSPTLATAVWRIDTVWPQPTASAPTNTTSSTTSTSTTTTRPATTTTTSPLAPPSPAPAEARSGYWMITSDGTVSAFGDAGWHGNGPTDRETVDVERTPSGSGYWTTDAAGAVRAFGDATFHGDLPALGRRESVTSLATHPSGNGYWLFTTSGRAFAYGVAAHLGDMGGTRLNGPVLDSIATPSGNGYFMVASDGGIFTFGDALFAGSMGDTPLNAPVQSLVPDPDGDGYWLVASDGGIFSFAAEFWGSMGSVALNRPVTGMVGFRRGYLMVAEDGGIFAFGDARFHGSLGDRPPGAPVVAVSAF